VRVRELNRVGHGVADVRGLLEGVPCAHEYRPDFYVLGFEIRGPECRIGDV